MTDCFTNTHLSIEFAHLVASYPIGRQQCHEADAAGNDPLRVITASMKRRGPDVFLILQDVLEKIFFE